MKGASGRLETGGPEGPSAGSEGPESRRRRLARRGLLVGGGVLGFLVLLYGAAAFLVHTLLDPATLSGWVEPRAEAALNRDVELEAARIRLFPSLGAELQGVQVSNLPDFEGPPLARIRAIRLQVAILPLFRRRIRVAGVRVEEPRIRLAVDTEGRANYGDLVPESREPPGEEGGDRLDLAVRDVSVRDGSLTFLRASDSVRFEVSGLEADAALEGSQQEWTGQIRVGSEGLVLGHGDMGGDPIRLAGPTLEARGAADREFGWVEVREGALRLGGAGLELTGRVEGLDEAVREVDLALRAEDVDVEELLEALPEASERRLPGRASGTLGVDLRMEGSAGPGRRPDVRGSVLLDSFGLRGPEGEVLVDGLGGRVELRPGELAARDVAGTVLDGPFSVEGTLRTDSTRSFEVRLAARPRLDGITGMGLAAVPEGLRLAGRTDVSLEMSGQQRQIGATRIEGAVEASEVRIEHPGIGVPVSVDEGQLVFAGEGATWRNVQVTLGEDRLATSGSVDDPLTLLSPPGEGVPRLDVEIDGSYLDLDAVLPPKGDPSVTYGKIAFAHLADRTIQGRSAEEWAREQELALPDSLPVAGEARIRLDTLVTAPYRLTELEAWAVFSPDFVDVTEARFLLYGGEVTARLRHGLGGGASQPFTLTLEARRVRAADFLEATSPLGRYVTGDLSLELDLAGDVDERMLPVASALAGTGRARVRDGSLEETPLTRALAGALSLPALAAPSFSEWLVPFEVEASGIRIAEAALAGTRIGPLRYGGAMGLDGSLDLGLRLAVPAARLDSLALGRSGMTSAVVGQLTGGDAPVGVGLGIGGTIQDPRIGPRASLATGELRRSLEQEMEERTGALRDTAEARTQEVRDTAAARLEAESRQVEERTREEAEGAREELEDRARDLFRNRLRSRDADSDTTPDTTPPSPDTASADTTSGSRR